MSDILHVTKTYVRDGSGAAVGSSCSPVPCDAIARHIRWVDPNANPMNISMLHGPDASVASVGVKTFEEDSALLAVAKELAVKLREAVLQ